MATTATLWSDLLGAFGVVAVLIAVLALARWLLARADQPKRPPRRGRGKIVD